MVDVRFLVIDEILQPGPRFRPIPRLEFSPMEIAHQVDQVVFPRTTMPQFKQMHQEREREKERERERI